jgi:DNA-binding NtrC family response regulator
VITFAITIIDDDPTIRSGIAMALGRQNFQVMAFATAEEAIESAAQHPPDLVLLDIGLPGMNGIEALGKLKSSHPELIVIMITAYEDVQTVISAMKLGAHDYVVKPINIEALEVRIENALKALELRKEVQSLQEKYLEEQLPCFIGESKAIQNVIGLLGKVAQSPDTPVLVLGATGTGKELIARAIHQRSPNFSGPLVAVNCAAIPRELIESELFGYERGAFSGAKPTGKKGMVEEAANGTLFLDEVGDLSLDAQAKLLRFLEDGEYHRVGGTRQLKVKTRVISATNKNIEEMIRLKLFRNDLYFRLGVIRIEIPSLNDRPEDVIPLARYFLVEFGRKFGRHVTGISAMAETALKKYHWTGNIRELRNLIERAVLVGSGPEVTMDDLGLPARSAPQVLHQEEPQPLFPPLTEAGVDLRSLQETMEKHYIEEALKRTGGNENKASQLLNLNYHTFRYRRKHFRIY